jgi:hypothetical protein
MQDFPARTQPPLWSGKRQTALQGNTGQGAASAARMDAPVIPLPLSKLLTQSVEFMQQQSMIGSDALVSRYMDHNISTAVLNVASIVCRCLA